MNRAQRRRMQHRAGDAAAKLASRCYDFHGSAILPVTDARAIAALTRAFTLLLRSGLQPVAVPISEAEAMAFPNHQCTCLPGGVSWLAVGIDVEWRASYALQSAAGADRALTHEIARERALSRLAGLCATPGFPMGQARGRA